MRRQTTDEAMCGLIAKSCTYTQHTVKEKGGPRGRLSILVKPLQELGFFTVISIHRIKVASGAGGHTHEKRLYIHVDIHDLVPDPLTRLHKDE